jgi:hypothetical protein
VGLTTHLLDDAETRARAHFNPFAADGTLATSEPLPTQLDLPEKPAACNAQQRQASARLVAPMATGTRHPVFVNDGGAERLLLTSTAILHGDPGHPCVASWQADSLRGKPPSRALITGGLDRAWLFRPTVGRKRAIDLRPMQCRYDTTAVFPEALWREVGVLRSTR